MKRRNICPSRYDSRGRPSVMSHQCLHRTHFSMKPPAAVREGSQAVQHRCAEGPKHECEVHTGMWHRQHGGESPSVAASHITHCATSPKRVSRQRQALLVFCFGRRRASDDGPRRRPRLQPSVPPPSKPSSLFHRSVTDWRNAWDWAATAGSTSRGEIGRVPMASPRRMVPPGLCCAIRSRSW